MSSFLFCYFCFVDYTCACFLGSNGGRYFRSYQTHPDFLMHSLCTVQTYLIISQPFFSTTLIILKLNVRKLGIFFSRSQVWLFQPEGWWINSRSSNYLGPMDSLCRIDTLLYCSMSSDLRMWMVLNARSRNKGDLIDDGHLGTLNAIILSRIKPISFLRWQF